MKLLIFDLDGTLIDSARDVARSVNELLVQSGRSPLPWQQVAGYIGNGVGRLLERALGDASPEEVEEARASYLAIYRRRLLETTKPYPGVRDALEALGTEHSLAVLTNKPRRESVLILEGLGLLHHFRAVYGGDSFPRRKPDPMGVRRLLDETRILPEDTLFIGDSTIDFETARNASVKCCLVSYGIRPESIAHLEPDFRVDDLRELGAVLGGARG